jgi:DNA-binding transcriptional LysR family regulator
MNLDISLSEMRTLQVAVEAGTFTAAAKRLGVTQPAVSRQLAKLEARLGVALFERNARRLALTPAGERLYSFAEETLRGFERVMQALEAGSKSLQGELRIGASTTLGDFLVPTWVRMFSQLNPGLMPQVFVSDSDAVAADVQDGSVEVGFIGREPSSPLLRSFPVAEDEVVLAVPTRHEFARRGQIRLAELAGQPFIIRERGSGTVGTVADTLHKLGLEQPKPKSVISMNSGPASLLAVQKGFGLCWISIMAFESGGVAGVSPVRISESRFERKLYLVHSRRALKPAATAFTRWLLEDHLAVSPSSRLSAAAREK